MKQSMISGIAGFAIVTFTLGLAPQHAEARWWHHVEEFKVADVFFEENTTDEDMGFHFKIDGEGWRRMIIFDSNGRLVVNTSVRGGLGNVGLTEISSESAEPGYDELSREDFLAYFPEGTYTVFGQTIDRKWLISYTEVTKNIPEGAVLVSPEEDEEVDAGDELVIEWELVDDPNPPESTIQFYEVVVEKDSDEGIARVLSVTMNPDDTEITIPTGFLEDGEEYKVEIISEETSGNRSSIEVPFTTAEED